MKYAEIRQHVLDHFQGMLGRFKDGVDDSGPIGPVRYTALETTDWEGVGDAMGQPTPVTPEGIDALLEIWPVFEAFQTRYVARGLILDAEKNVSAPLPSGPSAVATDTARPAKLPAPTAPQD